MSSVSSVKPAFFIGALGLAVGAALAFKQAVRNAVQKESQERSKTEGKEGDAAHHTPIIDTRIRKIRALLTPQYLAEKFRLRPAGELFVLQSRKVIADIIHGRDDRLLCIVGPCSIHSARSAREFGVELADLAYTFRDDLYIVMRVYFEKPRTTVGWKGLINDPDLDGSCRINEGLELARQILVDLVSNVGLPCAVEWLDTITPQYIADLVSWGAIGARTAESQVHRQLVSGVSMPVGFKNATSGIVKIAVDGCVSAMHSHSFFSVTQYGHVAIVETSGNKDVHIIHRGGASGTNYNRESIQETASAMLDNGVRPAIVVDCSHGNSGKDFKKQPIVADSVSQQLGEGSTEIVGVMIESNLIEGNQKFSPGVTDKRSLKYGQSITDSCVNVETAERMLSQLAAGVRRRREIINAH